MRIISVDKNSQAEFIGFKSGDRLVSINGHNINDALDFQFYSDDEQNLVVVERGNEIIEFEIDGAVDDQSFVLEVESLKLRHCGNKCIFCFIDQNPGGMRQTIYFKDEDYRFSFLHGHYVTLTNAAQKDIQRIIDQHMSPLYISVHAIEPEVRRKLFGLRRDDRLLDKVNQLVDAGIELHTQIVLCPGINDGEHLYKTVHELAKFYPQVKTVAVVPVGLSKHRESLYSLRTFDTDSALEVVNTVDSWGDHFKTRLGSRFVYLADEFYIMTQQPIPDEAYYESFDQFENGVGMVRSLYSDLETHLRDHPVTIASKKQVSVVTGSLAYPVIEEVVAKYFRRMMGLQINVFPITNYFYGEKITVSGLITGGDIYQQMKDKDLGDELWLPPNCVNSDSVFLDDWSPDQLAQKLGCKVKVLTDGFISQL